jgi:hypothetical protein
MNDGLEAGMECRERWLRANAGTVRSALQSYDQRQADLGLLDDEVVVIGHHRHGECGQRVGELSAAHLGLRGMLCWPEAAGGGGAGGSGGGGCGGLATGGVAVPDEGWASGRGCAILACELIS